jgi:hypothetical protein
MRFRCALFVAGCYSILLFLPSLTIGQTNAGFQVVFSRRVYKERGPSFQQIWSWNPVTGVLKALTQSARDHIFPACRNGEITYVSPDYSGRLWSFDPATGDERVIGPAPEPPSYHGNPRNGCDQYAQAGNVEACAKSEELSLSRGSKQVGHWNIQTNTCPIDDHGTIGKCDTPILLLGFSPDAKWLHVGELGLETGSTAPQYDFYMIDVSTMKLSKAASAAQDILWLPGSDDLLYVTPRDMAQLPGSRRSRSVWVQQLMLFDPVKGKSTVITSGVTNNLDPSLCSP